jgi:hypothetical protein
MGSENFLRCQLSLSLSFWSRWSHVVGTVDERHCPNVLLVTVLSLHTAACLQLVHAPGIHVLVDAHHVWIRPYVELVM